MSEGMVEKDNSSHCCEIYSPVLGKEVNKSKLHTRYIKAKGLQKH